MPDQHGTAAATRPQEIRLDCLEEVREWMKTFECREEELMLAVRAAGASPEAVRQQLEAVRARIGRRAHPDTSG